MPIRATRSILAVLALGTVFLSACSSSGPTTSADASTVMVAMGDKEITLSQTEVPAGLVTFMVMNRGTIVHSLVVIKTDTPHDQMPLDPADQAKVNETGSLAVTGQMNAGAMKQIQRQLAPGNYVLICNEPAHYAVGMHTGLVVR